MTPLSSSNLAGCDYDAERQILIILFRSGRTYRYADVPQQIADGLTSASSPGQYFNSAVKGVYDET